MNHPKRHTPRPFHQGNLQEARIGNRHMLLPPAWPPIQVPRHLWAPKEARELSLGRQGAGGSSWPSASVPRCPPRDHQPLTDFHSPVVQARGGGMQGVEAAVQLGGAVTQRGCLALEFPEDVPGAARQVGQLGEQADQSVRADLLQRAEERRARSPSHRRLLGPAQPRGFHAPLVEGHGWARGAPGDRRSRRSRRAPRAMGAGLHPTQRRVPGQLLRGRGRAARRSRDSSETLARCRAATCLLQGSGAARPRKFPEQFPGGRGGSRWKFAGRKAPPLLPSLRIGEGGGSGGSAADTGAREGGGRKGRGRRKAGREPPAAPAPAAPRAQAGRHPAPQRTLLGRSRSP